MAPQDKTEKMLQKINLSFASCPLCSTENSFKVVGLQKNIVKCANCKAEWTSRQLMNDEDLKSLTLLKLGKNKQFKALLGYSTVPWTRSVAWWINLIADPQSNEINKIVNSLLIEAFTKRESDPIAHEAAMARLDQLSPLGQAELDGIADEINSGGLEKYDNRYIALWYLSCRNDNRWVDVFEKELDSPDPNIRQSAVGMAMFLLSQTGNTALLPKIIDMLEYDVSVHVRVAAASSLNAAGPDPRVIDALQTALRDNDAPPTDPIVAGSLTGMMLAAAKSKPKASVGQHAWYSLASIDDPRAAEIAVRYFIVRYNTFSSSGLRNITKVIGNMGERAIRPLLSFYQSFPRTKNLLLEIKNERTVDHLINLLSDDEPIIRRNSAIALELIGDPRAIEPLNNLAPEENDPDAKTAMEQAIEKLAKNDQ